MEFEFVIDYNTYFKWIRLGMNDVINRFNLKPRPPKDWKGNLNDVPNSYYFTKRNTNRYFRKHLGFTYKIFDPEDYNINYLKKAMIKVYDEKKLFVFKLKYGL